MEDSSQNKKTLEERMEEFKELCQTYEIRDDFAFKIRQLQGFQIVIIADDSSSMNELLKGDSTARDPYGHIKTRWDELKEILNLVIKIAILLDEDGVDVHFLNKKKPFKNVTNINLLEDYFSKKPNGGTPIVRVLRQILENKIDQKRLIIIATDGKPTGDTGYSNIPEFKSVLESKRSEKDYVTILACTDDQSTMDYLNGWDDELDRLDVVDDFHSEKKEILAVQGPSFLFSFGDYVVKALLGSVDDWFDKLDEKKKKKRCIIM